MDLWVTEEDREIIRTSYAVTDVLFKEQSEFQLVEVVDTKAYGRMLLIDGLTMLTDSDEFVYHEMIAHVPALMHSKPKNVVVIGGGDGGTVRELLKHSCIEKITLCEIDALVVDASKKFFPKVAGQLDDDRVEVCIADGVAYIKELKPDSVDLILIDSTDPISVGEGLFSSSFYQSVSQALKADGLMACQSESPWFDKPFLQRIQKNVRSGFKVVKPYIAGIPTYPRGLWSWTLASNDQINIGEFCESRFGEVESGLNYLTPEMMTACFSLPKYYRDKVN